MTTVPFFRRLEKIDAVVAAGPEVCNFLQDLAPYLIEEASRAYLYDALNDPAWLKVLSQAGAFSNPPEPQENQTSGNFSFPLWPESRYLARMAKLTPETVLEILLHLPESNNIQIHKDLIDAALVMPPELSALLLPKVKTWIESSFQIVFPEKLGMLITHLAQDKQVNAAFELAQLLLAILPGLGTRIDIWSYEQILQKYIPSLVTASGSNALELLCILLNNALSLESEQGRRRESYSYEWRPAIEEHQQNASQGLRGLPDLLVSSVRDAAEQIVREQKASVKDVIFQLENNKKPIYLRLSLYILSVFPTSARALVTEKLANRDNFDNVELRHEYTLLATTGFALLSSIDQGKILQWVNEGPRDIDAYVLSYEQWTGQKARDELTTAYANHWRRDWLARLGPNLPLPWRQRYEKLVAKFGPAEHPEFIRYHTMATFVDSSSSLLVHELNSRSVKEIISLLKTWRPPQDVLGTSPQNLSRVLTAAIEANADRFAVEARHFRKLDPIFVRGVLTGFERAAKQQTPFSWEPVLDLCRWVINHSRKASSGTDTDWVESRKEIALLLSNGFEASTAGIPFTLRAQAWKALLALSIDPNPTTEEESNYSSSNTDLATLALNTVRGEAMHAVIRYALWARKHLKEVSDGREQISRGFHEMPEVRRVLNQHLDPDHDPSLAIRSVYGQWLPWLVLLDQRWVIQKMARIFPMEESSPKLRNAVWESYIVYCAPFDNVFEILQVEYGQAVGRIGTAALERQRPFTPDERLAEHLMILYWRGKLDLGDEAILMRFFAKAPDSLRAHAIKFVGLSLYNTKDAVPPYALDRLRKLWEQRLDTARGAKTVDAYANELGAFGWWFGSGKFDASWAVSQLFAVLTLNTGAIEGKHLVMESLAGYAHEMPLIAIECLDLLMEANAEGISILNWQEYARNILMTAYNSSDDKARNIANNLVNQLGASGYYEAFRDLATRTLTS